MLAADAAGMPPDCNRGMDSFNTWALITAPLLGVVVVCATVVATLLTA